MAIRGLIAFLFLFALAATSAAAQSMAERVQGAVAKTQASETIFNMDRMEGTVKTYETDNPEEASIQEADLEQEALKRKNQDTDVSRAVIAGEDSIRNRQDFDDINTGNADLAVEQAEGALGGLFSEDGSGICSAEFASGAVAGLNFCTRIIQKRMQSCTEQRVLDVDRRDRWACDVKERDTGAFCWIGDPNCGGEAYDHCTTLKAATASPGQNSYCTKTSERCVQYSVFVHRPSPGFSYERPCLRYELQFECLNADQTMGPATLQSRTFENFGETVVETCNEPRSGECTLASTSTTEGSSSKNINGMDVHRAWWQRTAQYDCTPTQYENTCGTLQNNTQCRKQSQETCLGRDDQGTCEYVEAVYDCRPDVSYETSCAPIKTCIGDHCTDSEGEASDDFPKAAAWLTFLDQTAKDISCHTVDRGGGSENIYLEEAECAGGLDPQDPAVFSGIKRACEYTSGLFNCCNGGGTGFTCGGEDVEVVQAVTTGRAHYLRTICRQTIFFGTICVRREHQYCLYNSKFARVFQEQAHLQIGGRFDPYAEPHCPPLSISEMESLDMEVMDLSEVFGDMMENIDLPVEEMLVEQLETDMGKFGGQVVFGS